jgi:hypothetical protein
MYELIQREDLPSAFGGPGRPSPFGKLPIRDLLPGQALRVSLAHLMGQDRRRAVGALRVRATRAGQATGATFATHLQQDTVYIARLF